MIYLVIVILFFGLLLAENLAVSRNLLYPPALFTAVWLISLIGLALSGDTLFAVSVETLMVYFIGAVAFSIGGFVVFTGKTINNARRVPFSPMRQARIRRILDIVLLFAVIGFPFYWQNAMANVDFSNPLFLAQQRMSVVEASKTGGEHTFSIVKNLVILSIFLAMAMHYENDGTFPRKWRAYFAILLALIYGSLTGTKGNIVTLFLTLTFISSMRAGKMNYMKMGSAIVLALSLFAIGLLYVNFAYMGLDNSMKTFMLLVETIRDYWLGGLVAFDRIVHDPTSMESVQNINRFFIETANGLGAHFYVPSRHADFTPISSSLDTNVYTIYFSYFKDYSWFGMMLGMSMLGGLLVWIYVMAQHRKPIAVMCYGWTATGIVLSIQAEHFVLGLNGYIKMLVFFSMLYIISRLSLLRGLQQIGRELND